jgi:hypothetical protein
LQTLRPVICNDIETDPAMEPCRAELQSQGYRAVGYFPLMLHGKPRAVLALFSGEVDVFALTDTLVKQLEPIKDKIVEVCKSHNLSPRLGVVLTLSADRSEASPEAGVGVRAVRFLADTGSFINVETKVS